MPPCHTFTQPPRPMLTRINSFPKPNADSNRGSQSQHGRQKCQLPPDLRFSNAGGKKKNEGSSLIYNLATVKMKNWVIVFRHNRQLLKEMKRRRLCSPSWRLHSSFENRPRLHPSGISTTQLATTWPQLVATMTGTDISVFWEPSSFSPPKWPIYLHIFQNYPYKETAFSHSAGKEFCYILFSPKLQRELVEKRRAN